MFKKINLLEIIIDVEETEYLIGHLRSVRSLVALLAQYLNINMDQPEQRNIIGAA